MASFSLLFSIWFVKTAVILSASIEFLRFFSRNLNFNNAALQLVEGKLKKNGYSNLPPIMMRAAPQQDTAFSEDQLGDYHIYQLNESINLLARESITTRLYPSKTISIEKTYLFGNDERRQKEEPLAIE